MDALAGTTASEVGLLVEPPRESWIGLLEANTAAASAWAFRVGGEGVQDVRRRAQQESLAQAATFSRRCGGIPEDAIGSALDSGTATSTGSQGRPIVVTGHQPELYHPGIWVKDFLVDRLCAESGATGLDVVVDSDAFLELAATAPCVRREVRRCSVVLAAGGKDVCYACASAPSRSEIDVFLRGIESLLEELPSEKPRQNFERFAACLQDAASDAGNLAELVTFARRRFEATAKTRYLEMPVTSLRTSRAFAEFVLDVAWRAEEFWSTYNEELDSFRAATSTRSAVQPFPNLRRAGERFELPFWLIGENRRRTLWVERVADDRLALHADEDAVGMLAQGDAESGAVLLAESGVAPKAVTLTLYFRVFVADLFVHGTGGARYDRVTDGVIGRFYQIKPPAFVTGSLTEWLPLEHDAVSDAQVAEASERANRFEHNPDALLDEIAFSSEAERERAFSLRDEKAALVSRISQPGADRKALGGRIRDVNGELRQLLAPFGETLRREAEQIQAARDATRILEDRTYPFCYWAPETIASRIP